MVARLLCYVGLATLSCINKNAFGHFDQLIVVLCISLLPKLYPNISPQLL